MRAAACFLHGIDQRENIVLGVGYGVKTSAAAESSCGPGHALDRGGCLLLLSWQLNSFGADTYHQRQRPCGHIVRLENAAVRGWPYLRIVLYAHHLIHESAVW